MARYRVSAVMGRFEKDRHEREEFERMQRQERSVLDAALGYAALGLRVVPLRDGDKVPRLRGWQHRASEDPEVIEGWFRKWPGSNLGIVTGRGLVALDVDDAKGVESFNMFFAGRRPPYTAVAGTGSGGYHYLFRVSPSIRIGNRAGFLEGLDVRGDGGQVVAAPSIHPATRRRYAWICHPADGIAWAPEWLVEAILDGAGRGPGPHRADREVLAFRQGGRAEELARDLIARFPVDGPGRRNDMMMRAVGSLIGRGYDPGLAREAVVAWWRHYHEMGLIRTPPTGADEEVRRAIDHTVRNPNFRQSVGQDHHANLAEIRLTDEQEEEIRARIRRGGSPYHPNTIIRVTSTGHLCSSAAESAFVEALLVYFTYKLHHLCEPILKGTRADLARIVQDRHGIRLDPKQFERLKTKYVTRPGRPATRCELVVQTREGRQGIPSEFELTGLLDLMALGTGTDSLVAASTASEAQEIVPMAAAA